MLRIIGAGGIRQTAKAPEDTRSNGGFAIYVDKGIFRATQASSTLPAQRAHTIRNP